eukprot:TRINITY_DN16922_c0_g1_i4.p1 TRINITY_DN16922_c0_g1~~TRINITY_DN16922_c0_g1_i4.p1  ORF type:complete len:489 (+),score=112.85 TRINITY_DN16922_c0_g1_i4:63-1469(+)
MGAEERAPLRGRQDLGEEGAELQRVSNAVLNKRLVAAAERGELLATINKVRKVTNQHWDFLNVATALYKSLNLPIPKDVLQFFADKLRLHLKQCPRVRCSLLNISLSLYGIHTQPHSRELRSLLDAMTGLCRRSHTTACPYLIGSALFGLQRQESSAEVEGLLDELATLGERCTQTPYALHVGRALYGLNRLEPSPAKERVLSMLAGWMRDTGCSGHVLPRTLCGALYGMRRQTTTPAADEVLVQLAAVFPDCTGTFNAQDVGTSLFGLHRQSSPAVEGVLLQLAPLLRQCEEPLCAQAIGNALYGLQQQRTSPAVRRVLATLGELLRDHRPVTLSPQDIGTALYGLQNQSPSAELETVLSALVPMVSRTQTPLDAQAIGNALFGLQNQTAGGAAEVLLGALAPLIEADMVLTRPALRNVLLGVGWMNDSEIAKPMMSKLVPLLHHHGVGLDLESRGRPICGLGDLTI